MMQDRRFWDRYARVYDLVTRPGNAELAAAAEWIAGLLNPHDRLLDAACGTGTFACALAPRVESVMACDYSSEMIARARRKASRARLRNIAFRVEDVTRLDLPTGAFDAAVCANVLHLLNSPADAVAELKRVLRPGGLLIAPNYVQEPKSHSRRMRLVRKAGFTFAQDWNAPAFEDFLSDQGLRVLDSRLFDAWQPLDVVVCRSH